MSTNPCKSPQISTFVYRSPRISTDLHRYPQILTDLHRSPQIPINLHKSTHFLCTWKEKCVRRPQSKKQQKLQFMKGSFWKNICCKNRFGRIPHITIHYIKEDLEISFLSNCRHAPACSVRGTYVFKMVLP